MGKSRLAGIINTLDQGNVSVRTDILSLYKKSLIVWYQDKFNQEPMLMVTAVFNAASYGLIAPANEFEEAVDQYIESAGEDEETKAHMKEEIMFNSIALKEL